MSVYVCVLQKLYFLCIRFAELIRQEGRGKSEERGEGRRERGEGIGKSEEGRGERGKGRGKGEEGREKRDGACDRAICKYCCFDR